MVLYYGQTVFYGTSKLDKVQVQLSIDCKQPSAARFSLSFQGVLHKSTSYLSC